MVNRFMFQEGTDEGTAIMIVGNKTDLIEDENGRPVKSQDGRKLAEVMTCFSAHQILANLSGRIRYFSDCAQFDVCCIEYEVSSCSKLCSSNLTSLVNFNS